MILSKFSFDIRNRYGRSCISDYQNMHRSIMRLFHCSRKEGSVLYRFHPKTLAVYILSENAPDISNIPSGMVFVGQKDMSAWEAKFTEGSCFRFDILVAPFKKVAEEGARNSRRRFLRTYQERLEWMSRKAEQSGFELVEIQENQSQTIHGSHSEEKGGNFYCNVVSYQGILRVSDKERFSMAWKQGIGAGKAYGQGMLMLVGIA